ncbi:myocardin-like, partial [Mustelus asterias]
STKWRRPEIDGEKRPRQPCWPLTRGAAGHQTFPCFLAVGCVRLPEDSDPFPGEEDSSSSNSASPEIPGERQSQGAVGARPQPTEQTRLGPFQRASKVQRQKRPKDTKPKVRKLKYHQYIPPDQKAEKSPVPMDAAYSRLLQQQQIFLQLQILNQQQQTFSFQPIQPGAPGIPPEQIIGFANTVPTPVPCIPLSPLTKSCQRVPSAPCVKPELLPANLDDLTVSELRQQLRKRGLPVSGTKPALLERLKPYQIFSPHVAAPPQPPALESREANVEDVSLVEKERVIERLTWRLQQEQRQAEGLREELELRKRHHQQHQQHQQQHQQQGGTDAAPSSLGEVLPHSPSGDSYLRPSPLEGSTENSSNSRQPRPLESHIGSNLPIHLG